MRVFVMCGVCYSFVNLDDSSHLPDFTRYKSLLDDIKHWRSVSGKQITIVEEKILYTKLLETSIQLIGCTCTVGGLIYFLDGWLLH